mmetsp:Transcript_38410/g.69236  ORF Transcript_38410/g.69236 Transcript_38410/m.69236 type:complete len:84 (-) Transcript_38410:240-491(-)
MRRSWTERESLIICHGYSYLGAWLTPQHEYHSHSENTADSIIICKEALSSIVWAYGITANVSYPLLFDTKEVIARKKISFLDK